MSNSSIYPQSQAVFDRNAQVIAGGVVSLNRLVEPKLAFVRAAGSRLYDADGNEYLDYHGAFGPYILGHNDEQVNDAVITAIREGQSLYGSGTTDAEGTLAQLLLECVPSMESVQLTNTGSEATYHALRLARAYTGREHVIVMQGGYNGWHNDVAFNVMTPLEAIGPRVSPGEYPLAPLSAGIPAGIPDRVHAVNFNDLASVEYVMRRHPVAAIILEPVLQNVGVVCPKADYLASLRALCDRYGSVLIFDEVKTGFRAALGGYQSICGVRPDLTVLGKAVANGYPLGVVGGKTEIMSLFSEQDPGRRVFMAGTYNAHPVSCAAGIATIQKLMADGGQVYSQMAKRTEMLVEGLTAIAEELGIPAVCPRVGSSFCLYFMDHAPVDWHDLAENHDSRLDFNYRQALIQQGIYHFPLPMKQGSVSAAHTDAEIHDTLERTRIALAEAREATRRAS